MFQGLKLATFALIMLALSAVFIFLGLVVPGLYINYVRKVNQGKCKCSEGFHREFIKYYSILSYVFIGIVLLSGAAFMKYMKKANATVLIISSLISLTFAYILYTYQKKMYEISCECATEDWIPKLMKIHSYIIVAMVAISMLQLSMVGLLGMKKKSSFRVNGNKLSKPKK